MSYSARNGRAPLDRFDVFAPHAAGVVVRIDGQDHEMIKARDLPGHSPRGLEPAPEYASGEHSPMGWWTLPDEAAESVPSTTVRYGYILSKVLDPGTPEERTIESAVLPDPRSMRQPQGVHELSCTYDPADFEWTDHDWGGADLEDSVLYEMHIGTFTPEGTFEAAIEHLDALAELGIDAVEVLPVNGFNGSRNWGYDGVAWYTTQEEYGGPIGLQRFVDACHERNLAVVLDVVYNHLGPSGNYLPEFFEVFTAGASSWGEQINLDDFGSDGVRDHILDNVRMWQEDFHIDGFRIDAVHALKDSRARHILQQIADRVAETSQRTRRRAFTIAESDLNDVRMVEDTQRNGLGMDGQWLDDWHHGAHWALSGESQGYYSDFASLGALAKSMEGAFFHDGSFSSFRGRSHGGPVDPQRQKPWQFVTYTQNHDQVGNRATGDRFSQTLSTDRLILAAALLLTQPYTPMIFQGEEWAASTPWPFFTAHPEPELADAVRSGRKAEFARMGWDEDSVPDPQAEETFDSAILKWDEREQDDHAKVLAAYRELIELRRRTPELRGGFETIRTEFEEDGRWLVLHRGPVAAAFNFGDDAVDVPLGGAASSVLWSHGAEEPTGESIRLQGSGAAVLRA